MTTPWLWADFFALIWVAGCVWVSIWVTWVYPPPQLRSRSVMLRLPAPTPRPTDRHLARAEIDAIDTIQPGAW